MIRQLLCTAALPALLAAGCTNVSDLPDTASHVSPGTLSWFLPKMTVQVTASFELTRCPDRTNPSPGIRIRGATVDARPVADPSSRRTIVVSDLIGWTTNNNVEAHLYPNGTLKSLGSKSEDQTATIIGNVFKSAVQVVALAGGLPLTSSSTRGPISYACTRTTAALLQSVRTLKAQQLDPAASSAKLAAASAALARIEDALTVSRSIMIGNDSLPPWKISGNHEIDLTVGDLLATQWMTVAGAAADDGVAKVVLHWEYDQADTAATAPAEPPAGANWHYRDPALAVLTVTAGNDPSNVLVRQPIAFAQWGVPRKLPLSAPVFTNLDWSFGFAEDGTPTDMTVNTTARGVAASNLLNAATTQASAGMKASQAAAAANSALSQLQNQDALLKAKLAVITDTNALTAAGGTP